MKPKEASNGTKVRTEPKEASNEDTESQDLNGSLDGNQGSSEATEGPVGTKRSSE